MITLWLISTYIIWITAEDTGLVEVHIEAGVPEGIILVLALVPGHILGPHPSPARAPVLARGPAPALAHARLPILVLPGNHHNFQ